MALRNLWAAILAVCALASWNPALAGPNEDALAQIEYDFANMQITKDPATISKVAAVMDEGFRFTDPARRDWGASKAQILMTIRSEKLVVS